MMEIPWGGFWQKSRNRLKAGWLITAGLVAIYVGAVEPMSRMKGISSSRANGLAASADWQPSAMWHQLRPKRPMVQTGYTRGAAGGGLGIAASRGMAYTSASLAEAIPASTRPQPQADDRKTVVTSSFNLIVKNPQESSKK